jgi:hypothetical protein
MVGWPLATVVMARPEGFGREGTTSELLGCGPDGTSQFLRPLELIGLEPSSCGDDYTLMAPSCQCG